MNKVAILLSTYNGEMYIREQFDSLYAQTYKDFDIIIRDDGSSDNTINIIKEYKSKHKNIYFYKGENKGPCGSFLDLIKYVDSLSNKYEYFSFCDQDDVWLPNKIEDGLNKIFNNFPQLFCGSFYITDEKLNILKENKLNDKYSLGNILVEGTFPGCTMLFNRSLYIEIINALQNEISYKISMHDTLVVSIALLKGEVITSEIPTMYYRQHSNNAIGATSTFKSKINKTIKSIYKSYNNYSFSDKAKVLLTIYSDDDLILRNKDINDCYNLGGSFTDRIKVVHNSNLYRRNFMYNFIFKVLAIFGVYRRHI